MKRRWILLLSVGLFLLIFLVVAFQYRYVALAKMNISAVDNGAALGLHKMLDVPLEGKPARFDYQSLDPQSGMLFVAHLGDNRVVVFDVKQGMVVGYIPDIANVHGVLAVPDTGMVYAAATGAHQVAVIDEDTLQVVARVDGGDYPDGLDYDPTSQKLFVSDEAGGGEIVIDTRTNQRINRIDLGGKVGNTHYDPATGQIIVAAQGRNQLALIDPQRETITASIDLPGCQGPHGFALDALVRIAYVACEENARLVVVDLSTQKIIASDSVGGSPDVLAFDAGLRRLYVASESGIVSVFQTGDGVFKKIGQEYLAPDAHSIAIDPQTHLVYIPLANVNGQSVIRIFAQAGQSPP